MPNENARAVAGSAERSLLQVVNANAEPSPEKVEVIELPTVADFFNGLDYVSGNRVGNLFRYSFEKSATTTGYKHFDDETGKYFKIPDQVDASNWGSSCSSQSTLDMSRIDSFRSFLEYKSKSWSLDDEQTTEISVRVPLKGAEVGLRTQISNSLGFGRSSRSQIYESSLKKNMSACFVQYVRNVRWSVQWMEKSIEHLKQQLSDGFTAAAARLKAICEESKEDLRFDERFDPTATEKPTLSACDVEAKNFVSQYGTHYNKAAQFGGIFEQGYSYDHKSMTSAERKVVSTYSAAYAGSLFFKGEIEESDAILQYERFARENLVITHRVRTASVRRTH